MPHRRNITTGRWVATFAKRMLGSQSGASFALALLLFLVCVLLTSAIIAASSAAVGHQAQLGKMEQRYYSVTSAARLIEELFTNEEVKVSCAKTEDALGATTWKLAIGDKFKIESVVPIDPGPAAARNLTQGEKKNLTLPELTALYYLQQKDAKDKVDFSTTWDSLNFSNYAAFEAAKFTLSTSIPATGSEIPASVENVNDHTEVSITESFDSYGRLVLTVSSAPSEQAADAADAYALTLLFDIDSDTTGSTEGVRVGTIAWKPAGISAGSQGKVTP